MLPAVALEPLRGGVKRLMKSVDVWKKRKRLSSFFLVLLSQKFKAIIVKAQELITPNPTIIFEVRLTPQLLWHPTFLNLDFYFPTDFCLRLLEEFINMHILFSKCLFTF